MGAKRKQLYHRIHAAVRHHPKLIASAKALKLPSVYVLGHITSMWLGALDFAEDGDLWRGDEESSLRFFESLAEIPEGPSVYLDVFRRDRWIDGWLIHDWLDHTSELLISRYSSHNRQRLVEIYQKHDRNYGKGMGEESPDPHPDGAQGKLLGSGWEVIADTSVSLGNNSDPPVTLSPKPQALNPLTLYESEKEALNPLTPKERNERSPIGGRKENAAPNLTETAPRADSVIVNEGYRVTGYPLHQTELTGAGLTHKEVFEAFLPLLVAHGILSLEAFFTRVKRSGATPAEWIMLYLDKVHAVYRPRQGVTLLDEDADPIGMTMAGLIPARNRKRHQHTEAARTLFIEIMTDHKKAEKGARPKWLGKLSGPAIVMELERRKGKASKIA